MYKWCTELWLDRNDSLGAGIEVSGDDGHRPTCTGPGWYGCLFRLSDLGHDCQVLDAGVVTRIVGDEREVVFEGGRGDPGVGYSYGASFAARAVGRFGPPEAQGAVEGIDDEAAQLPLHPGAASLPQLRSSAHRSSSATVMKETTRSLPVRWGR